MIKTAFHALIPQKPVIGMIHLKALPGSPAYAGSMQAVVDAACTDAQALTDGGVDAIMVENFYDAPFFQDQVGPETVASMARVIHEISQATKLPLGVNVLRNDVMSALAIAAACDCQFVRVNVLSSAMLTDQGIIEGKAAEVLRYRNSIQSQACIMADCMVKHAYRLSADVTLEAMVEETWERAGADALIISGAGTGKPTSTDDVQKARDIVPEAPLFIGSGVTKETIASFLLVADGVIVGTAVKKDGILHNPVDLDAVREVVAGKK